MTQSSVVEWPISLRELGEQHVNELWIPDHLLPHEVAKFAPDHFQRTVTAELEMLEVEPEKGAA